MKKIYAIIAVAVILSTPSVHASFDHPHKGEKFKNEFKLPVNNFFQELAEFISQYKCGTLPINCLPVKCPPTPPPIPTSVVPEPTTIIAGALLLLPLGVSTLRILRRNQMIKIAK
jgi:hypothetical protein